MEKIKLQVPSSGRYDIHSEVSRGGMGVIYRVLDNNLHRHLAMKVLLSKKTGDMDIETARDYFLEEALVTAQLEHPNIVPVHDLGQLADGNPFFTMKLVQGESLLDIIQQLREGHPEYTERYPLITRLMIFRKVCDAVAFAH